MRIRYTRLLSTLLVCVLMATMLPAYAADVSTEVSSEITSAEDSLEEVKIAGESRATKDKAIILIPGIAGSVLRDTSGTCLWLWLSNDRMNKLACDTYGSSVNKIVPGTGDYGLFDWYKKLYNVLNTRYSNTHDVLFFPYDWRLSNADNASKLSTATQSYKELIIVAHSMGGLVASRFLTNKTADRAKVMRLITLGTPFTGSVQSLYVAETGDFNTMLTGAGNILGTDYAGTLKNLVQNFPAFYQLMPTERYGTNYGNYIKSGTTNYSGAAARTFYSSRPWAKNGSAAKPMYAGATTFHNSLLISGTHVGNITSNVYKIIGTGYDTQSMVIYDSAGKYKDIELNNAGDGTVGRYSASNTQTISAANHIYEVNDDHMGLIDNATVNSYIKQIIDESLGTPLSIEEDEAIENIQDVEYAVNEKGWIIDRDNQRIYFSVYGTEVPEIRDGSGEMALVDGNAIYNSAGENIGSAWIVGEGGTKYCLKNDNYTISLLNGNSQVSSVKIEYQNNGYYEHSEEYQNLPTDILTFTLSDYSNFGSKCSGNMRSTVITPSHIMTETELAVRNQ